MRLLLAALALAGCGQLRSLTPADRLSPDEKLEYLILRTLEPAAAEQFLTLTPAAARQDFLNWFWQNRGEAGHQMYRARAEKARQLFGRLDLLGDDRVGVYIRYGPPRREEFAPRPVENETLRLFVNPAEIWTYDSLGLQFDFVKKGVGFKQVGFSRFGSAWFPPALEPVDYGKPPPAPRPDARRLEPALALYRLSQHQDTVLVELHYGVDLKSIPHDPDHSLLLHFEFRFDSRRGEKFVRSGWFGAASDTGSALVVGREVFQLPADIYQVQVRVVNQDGRIAGEANAELNLVDYVRRSQPASDILIYALVDNVFQSPQFVRPEWRRVVPLVVPEVKTGGTFYVLFEIYNLQPTVSTGTGQRSATK
jgi:hypothetical protein